jgi:hypothetical protein
VTIDGIRTIAFTKTNLRQNLREISIACTPLGDAVFLLLQLPMIGLIDARAVPCFPTRTACVIDEC